MKYIDQNKLIKYGFKNNKYEQKLDNNFKVIIYYKNNKLNIKVYDNYNEEYLPYYVKDNVGSFVSNIKEQVEKIVKDIYKKCEITNNTEELLLEYILKKYNTIPDKPFSNDNTSMTLKKANGKWYGIIMEIKSSKLKLDIEETIKILNIKLNPEKIKELIDNRNYFEAYHMNKNYWITIILDSKINIEKLKELIDESYKLVK